MEASTSDEHLSVSKLREKFNNSEVKSGAQEVKSGSFQQARAKFETNGTSQHSSIHQHQDQDKSPPASTQTTTINTNHHHKPPPPLLPKPRPNISETQPINNKTSPVQVPPKPLLKIASTQNENIPPPLRSAPFLSQHQEEEDADESLNFKQVLAKFTTKEVYINGRSLEKLRFRSHGPLETSQNGTHATSEHTPDPSNLNDSISDAETASEADDSSQDEDISDNEDSQSHLSNFSKDQNEIQSPNSRPGSFAKNDTLHTTVINEMRSRGLFKKLAGIGENLPSDIGKVRDPSAKGSREKPRKSEPPYQSDVAALNLAASKNEVQLRAPPIPPHRTSDISSAVSAHTSMATATDSFCSDRSSVAETLPTYNVGDEKEGYPKYMEECAEQLGKLGKSYKTLTIKTYPGQKNIMDYMCSLIEQILNVHKILLDDFEKVYEKWDSEKPNLAAILTMKADFLKICNQFLKEKPKLCGDLQKFIEEDKEFAYATRQFEDNVLNNNASTSNNAVTCMRGISLVMHLDAVHQNVVRYKLLMERYRKLLPDHLVEANLADEALKKLTAVSNTVNGFLADADASTKLLELYRKLQGSFDVFSPGRRLLHEGELQRQTRKDLQQRYLILFSDTLLICRYSLGSDLFDPIRLYKIPTDRIRVNIEDHEDYEREFFVISPKKSSAFIANSKRERDIWVSRLSEARIHMRELRQRKKTNGESRQKLATIRHSIESPDVENKSILEAPTPTSSKNFVPGRYEAVWIPDNKATKCLMAGCDTKFSMIQRKHHCRQCGWLICRRCVGTAPVRIKNYDSVKVCPQCYYEIKDLFEKGILFPSHMIRILGLSENSESSQDSSRLSIDGSNIRIAYEGGSRLEKPKDLFRAPDSGKLMKIKNPLEKDGTEEYIVSGKVQLRTKKGYEINRWGRFSRDYNLDFFEAEFDDSPAEKFFVYGYTLSVVENEDGSHVFELLHRNQFQTDRKEEKIIFKVPSRSAAKWLDTLKDMLIYDG